MSDYHDRLQACGLEDSDEDQYDSDDDEHGQADDLAAPSDSDEELTQETQEDGHAAPSPMALRVTNTRGD